MRLCYHFRSWDYSIHCAPVSTERRQYPRDFGAFQWMLTQAEVYAHYSGFKNVKRRPWVRPWRKLIKAGFISLLITVGTRAILKICIPEKYENLMLPCKNDYAGDSYEDKNGGKGGDGDDGGDNKRKLLSFAGNLSIHRVLAAAAAGGDYCSDGKASLISQTGLHIFIFVLAIFHVLYSVVTMALAQAKMKKWKAWEEETSSLEYQFTNDPTRFRLARQTSFVRRHSGISAAPGIKWIVAFFRQFTGSVTKVDYMTMRHGFINAHFAPNSKFDFHRYIKRCMEDHFKQVVGIRMRFKWHFSCGHGMNSGSNLLYNIPSLFTGCTDGGSHMKKAIFEEQTARALRKWQEAAKLRKKSRQTGGGAGGSSPGFMSVNSTPSRGTSPIHLLHKHRPGQPDVESVISSAMSYASDTELSEFEGPPRDRLESRKPDHHQEQSEAHSADFSFVKL
ncbi:hypothetical protein OIU77_026244 [Salix suchowensis]|uniref:MLO-like protein n=1 Tax=Salix suchowensis TaxID=1278906 RepID=A0ABQ9BYY9_9ROSI|nr:hypothetical protein OIU77_026244 [Salix suchowensis]